VQITILGKRWNLKITSKLSRDCRGECEPPDSARKEIRIRSSLKGEELLEVICHETLHAADWHKDESWVTQVAADLAKILTKVGFRKGTDDGA
jgi:hypothetical protein